MFEFYFGRTELDGDFDCFTVPGKSYGYMYRLVDTGEDLKIEDCIGRMVPIDSDHLDDLLVGLEAAIEARSVIQEANNLLDEGFEHINAEIKAFVSEKYND